MHDITQPFVNLVAANTALMTSFRPSPEAYTALMRGLTENYAAFVKAYVETLTALAADGGDAIINAGDRLRQTGYN